ncbi:hypothetical protein HPC49_27255 [Pyxidicoccus fallax]|uniref:Immunity MXAN-0049 protein domain-containing protein n=1 Tax=Pyxidicoccus fallax TaxID=394095 RepID=A0A848LIG6_9BACT|nr:DUF1629 domain-containing protein [Pyxidicoccus fallax]NMO17517.1 hypothetical protein [Pyxidicoccus fallax]NPC81904.1 hypothetical protein [Pyxidicoccus fallax]
MNYYPWMNDDEDRALAWVMDAPDALREHPKEYQLSEGVSVKDWFPEGVELELSDERGIKLTDSVPNVLHMCIVSEKFKALMEARSGAALEFLPVRLKDQKQQPVRKPYYAMNVLGTVDCVDLQRSRFRRLEMSPDRIFRFYQLVLDEKRIPPDAKIFRLKDNPSQLIVREDLGKEILQADIEGVLFVEMDEFGKEWGAR